MCANVAVVGSGYWGKNLVRNFHEIGALKAICDSNDQSLSKFKELYPSVECFPSYSDLLDSSDIHAVVLATPAKLHYQMAKQALLAGKHVFVEKPLALEAAHGEALCRLAKQCQRVLMVGHVLQYHPAVAKLKALVSAGDLGKLQYIYSNRLNFGKIRREENILWSFAPHDLSIILSLVGDAPDKLSASGANYLSPGVADTTMSQLQFSCGVSAHVYVSWLHPIKEQKLVVIGDKQMAIFDDTQPWENKLTLYPHEVVWRGNIPEAIKAEGVAVAMDESEPLKNECKHFVECIEQGTLPVTSGDEGAQVLGVLSALQSSLEKGGEWVDYSGVAPKPGFFAHPSVEIDQGAHIGEGTKIWHHSHILGNSYIGEKCSFGQNCVVGPNVKIGNGVKVQNNISIYEGVEVEDDVFLGPSMVFTNVMNPRSFIVRKSEFKKTHLKKGASVGANATIVCGVTLGEYSFVAAGAVVTKDVEPFSLVAGVPAKHIGWVSKAGNRLTFENNVATDLEDNTVYTLEANGVVMNDHPAKLGEPEHV
jgi:predicted dehydrogenase/acetyltransferase-like isoleucine patch superfamily enzyme